MIVDPQRDRQCLDQATAKARELSRTPWVRRLARRLGTRRRVIDYIRSRPQADDDGTSSQFIACDVPQRARFDGPDAPEDPNCFERAILFVAIMEVIEPRVLRMLDTIERPHRHTRVLEWNGDAWVEVNLFPYPRNIDWGDLAKQAIPLIHDNVGKPLLQTFIPVYGGTIADKIGDEENSLLGVDSTSQKKNPPATPAPAPKPAAPANPHPVRTVSAPTARRPSALPSKGGPINEEARQPALAGVDGARPAPADAGPDDSGRPPTLSRLWGW